ncbi:hypothetical protein OAT97_00345 [Gammaproteobacteria bacterium]|nr:hypothetical protein [Gammaproteobacteria bacterium]
MSRYFLLCAFILSPNIAFAFGSAPEPDNQQTTLATENIHVAPNTRAAVESIQFVINPEHIGEHPKVNVVAGYPHLSVEETLQSSAIYIKNTSIDIESDNSFIAEDFDVAHIAENTASTVVIRHDDGHKKKHEIHDDIEEHHKKHFSRELESTNTIATIGIAVAGLTCVMTDAALWVADPSKLIAAALGSACIEIIQGLTLATAAGVVTDSVIKYVWNDANSDGVVDQTTEIKKTVIENYYRVLDDGLVRCNLATEFRDDVPVIFCQNASSIALSVYYRLADGSFRGYLTTDNHMYPLSLEELDRLFHPQNDSYQTFADLTIVQDLQSYIANKKTLQIDFIKDIITDNVADNIQQVVWKNINLQLSYIKDTVWQECENFLYKDHPAVTDQIACTTKAFEAIKQSTGLKFLANPLQYDYIILNDLQSGINACKEQKEQDYADNSNPSYFAPRYANCLKEINSVFFQTAYPESLHNSFLQHTQIIEQDHESILSFVYLAGLNNHIKNTYGKYITNISAAVTQKHNDLLYLNITDQQELLEFIISKLCVSCNLESEVYNTWLESEQQYYYNNLHLMQDIAPITALLNTDVWSVFMNNLDSLFTDNATSLVDSQGVNINIIHSSTFYKINFVDYDNGSFYIENNADNASIVAVIEDLLSGNDRSNNSGDALLDMLPVDALSENEVCTSIYNDLSASAVGGGLFNNCQKVTGSYYRLYNPSSRMSLFAHMSLSRQFGTQNKIAPKVKTLLRPINYQDGTTFYSDVSKRFGINQTDRYVIRNSDNSFTNVSKASFTTSLQNSLGSLALSASNWNAFLGTSDLRRMLARNNLLGLTQNSLTIINQLPTGTETDLAFNQGMILEREMRRYPNNSQNSNTQLYIATASLPYGGNPDDLLRVINDFQSNTAQQGIIFLNVDGTHWVMLNIQDNNIRLVDSLAYGRAERANTIRSIIEAANYTYIEQQPALNQSINGNNCLIHAALEAAHSIGALSYYTNEDVHRLRLDLASNQPIEDLVKSEINKSNINVADFYASLPDWVKSNPMSYKYYTYYMFGSNPILAASMLNTHNILDTTSSISSMQGNSLINNMSTNTATASRANATLVDAFKHVREISLSNAAFRNDLIAAIGYTYQHDHMIPILQDTPHPTSNLTHNHLLARMLGEILHSDYGKEQDALALLDRLIQDSVWQTEHIEMFNSVKQHLEKIIAAPHLRAGIMQVLRDTIVYPFLLDQGFQEKIIGNHDEIIKGQEKKEFIKQIIEQEFKITYQPGSWVEVDADGNPNKSMASVITAAVENSSLQNIYNNRITNNNYVYQSRISAETKKGVTGIAEHLSNMAGVNQIHHITQLAPGADFEDLYTEFVSYLEQERYSGINSPLDLILRFTPNLFDVTSLGTIISDFPDDTQAGLTMLARLRFIQIATARYLGIDNPPLHRIQVLCEDHSSLLNVNTLFNSLLAEIQQIYNDNLELFFVNNNFVFEPFFGPSDTMTKMGSLAKELINKQILQTRYEFEQFTLTVGNNALQMNIGNGRGNGIGRSGISILPVNNITMQGTSYSTESRSAVLETVYLNLMLNNQLQNVLPTSQISSDLEQMNAFQDNLNFQDYGSSPYISYWGDFDNGIYVNEYNALVADPNSIISHIADKNISGTSGSRGTPLNDASALSFANQRAIGKDMLKYASGLPRLMGIDWSAVDDNHIIEYLQTTRGFDLVVSELIDFLQSSPTRSSMLGFSEDSIQSGIDYHNSSIGMIGTALDRSNANSYIINEQTTQAERLEIVRNILGMYHQQITGHSHSEIVIANRIDAYLDIVERVSGLNQMVDEMIKYIDQVGVDNVDKNMWQSLAALIWINVDVPLPNVPNF